MEEINDENVIFEQNSDNTIAVICNRIDVVDARPLNILEYSKEKPFTVNINSSAKAKVIGVLSIVLDMAIIIPSMFYHEKVIVVGAWFVCMYVFSNMQQKLWELVSPRI